MISTIGRRIKEKRESLGMTQEQLAEKLGRGHSWLGNIETDKRPIPGIDVLMRLCEVLKTTPTYILTGYDEKDITLGEDLGLSGEAIETLRHSFLIPLLLNDILTVDRAENIFSEIHAYLFPASEWEKLYSKLPNGEYEERVDNQSILDGAKLYALVTELRIAREEMQNGKP